MRTGCDVAFKPLANRRLNHAGGRPGQQRQTDDQDQNHLRYPWHLPTRLRLSACAGISNQIGITRLYC